MSKALRKFKGCTVIKLFLLFFPVFSGALNLADGATFLFRFLSEWDFSERRAEGLVAVGVEGPPASSKAVH